MILLDTHVWVWRLSNDPRLSIHHRQHLQANRAGGLGVSIISCWEVAKLLQLGRLSLSIPVLQWIRRGLARRNVLLLELTPEIAVESSQLPGAFHRDPADQIIVATARIHGIPLLTADARILNYSHVTTLT